MDFSNASTRGSKRGQHLRGERERTLLLSSLALKHQVSVTRNEDFVDFHGAQLKAIRMSVERELYVYSKFLRFCWHRLGPNEDDCFLLHMDYFETVLVPQLITVEV